VFLALRRRDAGADPARLPETTPSTGAAD